MQEVAAIQVPWGQAGQLVMVRPARQGDEWQCMSVISLPDAPHGSGLVSCLHFGLDSWLPAPPRTSQLLVKPP